MPDASALQVGPDVVAEVAREDWPGPGELLGVDRLEQLAIRLAGAHGTVPGPGRAESLPARLAENGRTLSAMYLSTSDAVRRNRPISFSGEWILNNFHIIQDQLRECAVDLPWRYYLGLPKVDGGEFAGLPRVYALVASIVAHTDGHFELDTLERCVRAHQTVSGLTIGELWAVPIALRLALLERLAQLAAQVDSARVEIETADQLVDELIAASIHGRDAVQATMTGRVASLSETTTTMFVAEMLQRLRDQGDELDPAIEWLEGRLASQGMTVDEALRRERQTQAANQVSVGNAITSMRAITATDWSEFFERLSIVDAILAEDPTGDYSRGDFATRDRYRRHVERIAKRAREDEPSVARIAVQLARDAQELPSGDARRGHVGYYLVDSGLSDLERLAGYSPKVNERIRRAALRHATAVYLGSISLVTAALVAGVVLHARSAGGSTFALIAVALLAVIPLSDLAVSAVNYLVTSLLEPRVLPKLDSKDGIPAATRTMVVVPVLFSNEDDVREALEKLEVRFLGNQDAHLHFGVLSDFTDAPTETTDGDRSLVDHAVQGIRELNERHGADRFFLFHRHRVFNSADGIWMGWERKRGKLDEFNRLLAGDASTSFSTIEGDTSVMGDVRYVITLDADTTLPPGTARKLVGTIAHPLNRARIDDATGLVVEGYGILQPRVSVSLEAFSKSRFSRMFSGYGGVDPYTTAVSDVYQDLFGEGSFVGKGIYDVQAVTRSLDGRVPENSLLSHDLFEGSYARTALVTDVELFDDYPSRYDVYTKRKHRWTRGDWQLAPWLLPWTPSAAGRARNVLSAMALWKFIDNLRRSLVGPAALLLLVAGWTLLPGSPLFWTLLTILIVTFPVYAQLLSAVVHVPGRSMLTSHFRNVWEDLASNTTRVALAIAFHPHQASVSVDAIARVSWRLLVTRRGLLEWVTAAESERRADQGRVATAYRVMWFAIATALASVLLILIARPEALIAAAPILAAWIASPAIATWLSHSVRQVDTSLTAEDETYLRGVARSTWRFFERFVTEEDNWLPPDNFQEDPSPVVARRTSPTNIGLALLAGVAARDLGYVGLLELVERTEFTFDSVHELERLNGHFLNWYDTATLEPLMPRYVSTVDSGNLAGHLLVLKQACLEAIDRPILSAGLLAGFADTLDFLDVECSRLTAAAHWSGATAVDRLRSESASFRTALEPAPETILAWQKRLEKLGRLAGAIADTVDEISATRRSAEVEELRYWSGCLASQARSHERDLAALAPWAALASSAPPEVVTIAGLDEVLSNDASLAALSARASDIALTVERVRTGEPSVSGNVDAWLAKLRDAANEAREECDWLRDRLESIAARAGRLFDEMDFGFLFDESRKLFSIGYSVETARLDNSYYDLLASEARLASYIAVAKGDAPAEHWHRLGRGLTQMGGDRTLISWSGSMFEYLMPCLVMRTFDGTLLDRTCRAAVREQIAYGKRAGVPWGVSEAAYNARDLQRNYQYGPFGVPGLGLKRGLVDELVVAPYASALALLVENAAVANLKRLEADGARGRFGFYESLDFTPSRVEEGERFAIVRTFMAHHEGMTLLAVAEKLLGGRMKARFHAEPAVNAYELLLSERSPRLVPPIRTGVDADIAGLQLREHPPEVTRYFETTQYSTPRIHLLSNGSYSVMMTTAGGGYSRCGATAITRWREDVTCDNWGQFCYLRDIRSGEIWSTSFQPTLAKPTNYSATFSLGKAEYRREDHEIETHTTVSVSTEDDAEVRSVRIANLSSEPRELDVTSYGEIVLTTQAADQAHQAFSNLFVQTEFAIGPGAILATRRKRSPTDPDAWAVHVSAVEGTGVGAPQFETDRARFIGRSRTTEAPVAVAENRPLSNTSGAVLDPIMSLRRRVRLGPKEEVTIYFTTAFATSHEQALALAGKYSDAGSASRASELAWTDAQVELRHLGMSAGEAQSALRLASRLLYTNPDLRARPEVIARNRRGQSGLWAYGISGDLPIVVVRVSEPEHVPLVRQLLRAHGLWRLRGLAADLVVLNEHPTSYQQEVQEALLEAVRSSLSAHLLDNPGGVFVRRSDLMPEEDRVLLLTVARAILVGGRGTLAQQIERKPRLLNLKPDFTPRRAPGRFSSQTRPQPELDFFNGTGGFTEGGREYRIALADGQTTPAPWSNVVSNPGFGFVVTESGGGFTWAGNSRENRLTPWSNDAVSDPVSEAIYLRDEDTGESWTPTPMPIRLPGTYAIRHGQGYSVFEFAAHGIESELTLFVPPADPVKLMRLKLRNTSGERRRLTVMSYAALALGVSREVSAPFVLTEVDTETGALLARNHYNNEFASRVAFVDSTPRPASVTAERREFIGRNGTLSRPNALHRTGLSGQVGAGLDACAALDVKVTIEAGSETEVVFALGEGADLAEARRLVERYREPGVVDAELENTRRAWDTLLDTVHVETPDRALDVLVNRWLPYQTIGCRVWARSGFYQSGGAYGFRDQLQDVAAAVYAAPAVAREQILRAASRQFVEGDVQHWWHPPTGRGVRTHISDDLLWLPFVAMHYADVTGDLAIFDEPAGFIEARQLGPSEDDAYLVPDVSPETSTIFDHCVRAIARSLAVGEHGLPLMGAGDWNDGMNRVGHDGRGESVWMGWFLSSVLVQFAAVCDSRGEPERAVRYREHAESLVRAIEENGWDGDWYLRAFFDDGTPLGSAGSQECRIDSIAQSWSVISGGGDAERRRRAMASVDELLVHLGDRLVMLLAPPFDRSSLEPGYIKGYVPGVRENGGQYTHAAIWVVLAHAMLGDGDRAGELFNLLNPVRHTTTRAGVSRYRVEPYVVAADVYAVAPHTGRGGWTWYTGSASWMYRVALESLLGFTKRGSRFRMNPCVPRWWKGFTIDYRADGSRYHVEVENPDGVSHGVALVEVDGIAIESGWVEIAHDGREHRVRVVLGEPKA